MGSFTEEPDPVYRTRSGRVVRQVPRYEPEEDTIFVDAESSDSDYHENQTDLSVDDDMDLSMSEDASDDTDSDSDLGSDSDDSDETSLASLLADEDILMGDVLDWDRLTDDAGSGDEFSEADDEYDDDEEDTEIILP